MELLSSYGAVLPPQWQEVWIVAGGAFAQRIDLEALRGRTILAVNEAAFLGKPALFTFAAATFSVDSTWIRRRRAFLTSFPGEKYLAVPLDTFPECSSIPGAVYLQWSFRDGLSDDPRFLCTGGNSGYAAINLAYLKGAKIIHLIGYDMDGPEDKYRQWIPRFRSMLPQLQAHGVQVLNHNINSRVNAFPFAPFKEMTQWPLEPQPLVTSIQP